MARKTKDELIAELKAREDALRKRRAELEAAQTKETRKTDTRRKIVLGGALLARCQHNPQFAALAKRELAQAITKDRDRELLADWLPPQSPASVADGSE